MMDWVAGLSRTQSLLAPPARELFTWARVSFPKFQVPSSSSTIPCPCPGQSDVPVVSGSGALAHTVVAVERGGGGGGGLSFQGADLAGVPRSVPSKGLCEAPLTSSQKLEAFLLLQVTR